MKPLLGFALTLVIFVPVVHADDVKTDKIVEKKDLNKANPLDKEFLVAFHQCNNAAQNALVVIENLTSSDRVKEFAKQAKKDHDDLGTSLGETIKNQKLAIVATPDKEAVTKVRELFKKKGEDVDQTFFTYFIKGHEKALKMAENQKNNGKDEDIRKFAEKTIPVLRDHLKKAKELQKKSS